ncbi:MAG TPA: CHAT domain-containing protein [Vicinamibacterales bacterium]|nr:CHAT domain-containing protein [Vicinamibacterales bacterium]
MADSLERLAATQMRMERFDAARASLDRAYAIRVAYAATQPLQLARVQELTAWLYRYSGDYRAAWAPLESALDTRRRLQPNHPDLVGTIELRGDLMMLDGDVAAGVASWQEALALAERTLGGDHPIVSALERRIVVGEDARGNRVEARRRLDRALALAERTRAPCDPELISVIDYAAGALTFDGEYVEARKRYEKILRLSEDCFGLESSITATVVFNLGSLDNQMGDIADAELLLERAIKAWSARGTFDPFVAKGLDALAEVFESSGRVTRARELLERALEIRQRVRADHPDVGWTLTNLARVVASQGDLPRALRHLARATEILKRSGTSIEPDHLARTVTQRGEIQARLGHFALARTDFAEALALRERLFGSEHPLSVESRLKTADADFALGRVDQALSAVRQAHHDALDHIRFTVRYLPERRALAYASRLASGVSLELSLALAKSTVQPSAFLDTVIQSRSLVLDEIGARAHVVSDQQAELLPAQARWSSTRQRYANLMLRSMDGTTTAGDVGAQLSAARREQEDAEQALAERSAAFRAQRASASVGVAEVRASLPSGSALVSFVRYDRTLASEAAIRGGGAPRRTRVEPSYLAFVLKSGEAEPAIVPLGAAARIDRLVEGWRRQIVEDVSAPGRHDSSRSLTARGRELRALIWDPVAAHLGAARRAFVVPDGALNLVSLDALPGTGDEYLVERPLVIHYVSAERDLTRMFRPPSAAAGLLAIGGPAFFDTSPFAAFRTGGDRRPRPVLADTIAAAAQQEQVVRRSLAPCALSRSVAFDALPGSRVEAERIGRLWDQAGARSFPAADVARVLIGPDATERAVKQGGPGRRILHLATHGFFLGDDCETSAAGTRAVGGLSPRPDAPAPTGDEPRPQFQTPENPLLLSGLAFAGANWRASATLDEDDGILTAEEVAALNLEGVEWAVLSACNTGLGTVAPGEGIFGLRRAFQAAGVRTVIMSLWAVDDSASLEWMEALYHARLIDRLDTADSVRAANVAVIRERRASGRSTHPFYWAAFVAAGDWR